MKGRAQGDVFITLCTVPYKLFITQASAPKYPANFPSSLDIISHFSPPRFYFPLIFVVVLFLLSVQLQLSAESVGEVYIKSTKSGQYLAMDTNGLLYGSVSARLLWDRAPRGFEVCRNLVALSNANRKQQLASVCYFGSWTATLRPALFWGAGGTNK